MTRALVVYESMFGNARAVAQAIADGLSATVPTDVVAAAEAPAEIPADVGLLVVGGPNHAFSMPRPATRQSAVTQHGADVADTSRGLREWLAAVHAPTRGLPAAAFDTRVAGHPALTRMDHAARATEKLLGKLGTRVAAPAEHFAVADTRGPLVAGEQDRARRWGRELAERVHTTAAS
ncbi:flavodoxin family protein [Modestobacter sp. SSW1-42]|uniref:flavodoxin family protein n=1 Tax=Modestobacter sp. SSW1-42 TaxID=596372 RepID=UPI00398592BF